MSDAPDTAKQSPLARFEGAAPPAPAWFTAALADAPERSKVEVDGAAIEVLTWGDRGAPGLLLLHGNGAHADWWRFIAPFFARTHRVAALSWAGMGGSEHRDSYNLKGFVAEARTVSEDAGLFDNASLPVVVGHSFGGFPMMAMVADDPRWGAAVIVDTPFREAGEPRGGRPPNATNRPHRVYPTLAGALARFRFAPEQGCENLFIADHIARGSLKQVEGGWTWRFDPFLWTRFDIDETRSLLERPLCPVALLWGEQSLLMPPDRVERMRAALPAGSPAIGIPSAEHHVMVDQPLAFVTALRGLLAGWAQADGAP